MNIWKPTQAEATAIRAAAARECGLNINAVVLQPGRRWNTESDGMDSDINIARITKHSDWGRDTDLDDYDTWSSFRSGVRLTDEGRAIVDFYVAMRNDPHNELQGNVVVHYEGGRIVRIHGYGPDAEHPVPAY